jgi:Rha family phage regulatory protein
VVADSRDVAAYFGKEHRRALQTIRELHCSEDFRQHNFVPFKIKDLTGESTSHVEMTESGFMRLVGGFNGPKAGLTIEAWINQFQAMKAELARLRAEPSRPIAVSRIVPANWRIFLERLRIARIRF